MIKGRFVAYFRVSTTQQKESGLGLEAQQQVVSEFLHGRNGKLLATFVETESGKRDNRPELAKALAQCRLYNATLIVAKLDRLARNADFLMKLVKESGKSGVVFCDLPEIPDGPVGKFIVQQMASVAELEAGLISQRTRSALAAVKARGVKLGCKHKKIAAFASVGAAASSKARKELAAKRTADLFPVIEEAKSNGAHTLRALAAALNAEGIEAPRGGAWTAVQVSRVLKSRPQHVAA
jgi:DNA invertase Pin-like site-specific DNA recombinase